MFFWILGDILVELGCQEGSEIAEKIHLNLSAFLNEILMDFGSPGEVFGAACPNHPTQGNIPEASRAKGEFLGPPP